MIETVFAQMFNIVIIWPPKIGTFVNRYICYEIKVLLKELHHLY